MMMQFAGITCVTALFFFVSFSAAAGTFHETFRDGKLEAWQTLSPTDEAPGSWVVVNGELHGVSPDRFPRFIVTGDETWDHYTVEFDIKPLIKHGVGSIFIATRVKRNLGIRCRIGDPIALKNGKIQHKEIILCDYGHLDSRLFRPFYRELHPLPRLKKWVHFKLSVQHNILTFWINDKQVVEPTVIPDPGPGNGGFLHNFQTGGAGIGLANYTARIDNIAVTGDNIPNNGLAVTPRAKLATTWGNLKRF